MMLSETKGKLCCGLANLQCAGPILQNVSLCDRNCKLQTILKEGIVLNIFSFITQKNISKGFHGKKYLKLFKSLLSSG